MNRVHKNINYTLIRSKRRTSAIQIGRDGQVSLRVPMRMTIKQVEALIAEKQHWINKHLSEWRRCDQEKIKRKYEDGESFPYLGKSYPLKIVADQAVPLVLNAASFCLRSDHGDISKASAAFKTFYREKGIQAVGERAAFFREKMGVKYKRIRMSDAKTRWASCSSKGNLNFHWKCLMLPAAVLDYIVVHELAHLIQMNHSSKFWAEVEKMIPDYRECRKFLRVNGSEMVL